MKLVYTNENRLFVNNAQNILENHNIKTTLKNEHAGSAVGDLSPFQAWPEIWVVNDDDHPQAVALINKFFAPTDSASDWECEQCHEKNHPSFELCWQCQADKPD